MKSNIFLFLLIIQLNKGFSIVPKWKFEKSVKEFISSLETQKDYVIYNQNGVKLVKRIIRNNDNSISSENLLSVNNGTYISLDYDDIGSSYSGSNKQLNQDYLICPKGKAHPYNPETNEKFIPTEFEETGNWILKCFTHKVGYFYVAYFYNNDRNFYGTKDKGSSWEHNYVRSIWYAQKLNENYIVYDDHYAMMYINSDNNYLKLTGSELVVNTNNQMNRPDTSQIGLFDFQLKDHTQAYFSSTDDSFYYMTYGPNDFYSGYCLYQTITDYSKVQAENNPGMSITQNLISPLQFEDNIEIIEMNFVPETKYIYYKIKNTVSGKNYHGVIDIVLNQVIFNTYQDITPITPK